jgi:alpha-L-arabinofuranosidase
MRIIFLSAAISLSTMMSAQITVNTSSSLATGVSNKIGINLNAMYDNDVNRPAGSRPIVDVLKEMNVKHLRFPGGQKSHSYRWTSNPFSPDPTTNSFSGWYYTNSTGVGYSLLNFDQFMSICQQVGAEPHLVVAIPSSYTSANVLYYDTTKTKSNIDLAVAWVKYANITKGYGVKYWEMANEELYLALTDAELAKLYIRFSDAMKAVDPTIKILAACKSTSSSAIKNICRDKVDILTTGSYPCWQWGTYDTYMNTTDPDLMVKNDVTAHAFGGSKVIMYEFNAIDYSEKKMTPWHGLIQTMLDMLWLYSKWWVNY